MWDLIGELEVDSRPGDLGVVMEGGDHGERDGAALEALSAQWLLCGGGTRGLTTGYPAARAATGQSRVSSHTKPWLVAD